jgi:type IV pilus assembly protein PilX
MVMLLLSLLLAIGSARVGLLNQSMSGNSADYQRAFEAAQTLMADAQIDLACISGGCTYRSAATQIPCDTQQFDALQTTLSALAPNPPCKDGICLDLGTASNGDSATSFWNSNSLWATYTTNNRGARFGQYSNSALVSGTAVNPVLLDRAWYWIEVLPYGGAMGSGRTMVSEGALLGASTVKPDQNCPFVFRITAVARGLKPGTTAAIQTLYFHRPT